MKNKKLMCLLLVTIAVVGCTPEKDPTTDISGITDISSWISNIINSTKSDSIHIVTFMDGDEIIGSEEVEHNDILYKLPEVPAKDGYDGSWDYDFSPIKEDMTVYPKYEPITYNISYISEYGEANPVNKLTYTIEDERFNFYAPINGEAVGRYFLGWYTSEGYEEETKISHVDKGTFGNITLYAKWVNCAVESVEGFTIDYETETLPTISKVVDSTVDKIEFASLVTVSEECYWILSNDKDGSEIIESKTITIDKNGHNYYYLTVSYGSEYSLEYLVDIYKLGKYSYSFVVDEKVVKEDEIEGNLKIEKIDDPTKEGYTFIGWTIDGENIVTFPYETISNVSFKALFTSNKYQIELDYQNEKYKNETKEAYYDESITLPSPTKEGYTFVGWQDKDTHQIVNNEFVYKYDKSITLEAVYKANKYTINIDKDGDGNYETTIEVTYGETITLDDPEISGRTFSGWTDAQGNVISSSYTHVIDNDIYIKGNWDTNIYSINYNVNGGTNSSNNPNSYTINDEIIFEAASKYGYTFEGWYLDSDFNNKIEKIEAGTLAENIKLYAKFVANKYTINIDKDGDGVYETTIEVTYGEIITLDDPEISGRTFSGWTDAQGNVISSSYTHEKDSDIYIKANWDTNNYSINYNVNGGTNSSNNPNSYTINDEIIFEAASKYGYTFEGWYLDSDFNNKIEKIEAGTLAENIKLYAKFVANKYTINIDKDGDGVYETTIEVTYGEIITLDDPEISGKTFINWTDAQGNVISSSYTHVIDNDIYIKGNWDTNIYSINYNVNGGTNSSNNPNSYTINDEIIFEAASKYGYTFEGWYLDSDFNNKIEKIEAGTLAENIELYAKFVANKYELIIKDDKGNTTSTSEVYFDTTFVTPDEIIKEGYTFIGWKDQNGNEYEVNKEYEWTLDEDIVLTSVFKANEYEITVDIDDSDSCTITGVGKHEYGENVTLTVNLNNYYGFLGWYDENDKLISYEDSIIITMGSSNIKYKIKTCKADEYGNYIIDGIKYRIDEDSVSVVGYTSDISNEAVILSELKGKEVTSIESNAFDNCKSLTSIVIPNSVTSIKYYAFLECSSLISITFEKDSQLNIIGEGAFSDCSSLASITIPSSVTSIGEWAFKDCTSLENVYYDGTIEDWCKFKFKFYYDTPMMIASHFYMKDENNEYKEVTNIEIPDTITSIGDYQFCGFNNVTSIVIPSSVTSIGEGAFEGCTSLETITLPFIGGSKDDNQKLSYIFGSVPSSLKEVIILEGCTSIGDYAFAWCDSLTNVVIPTSVTSIKYCAFVGCSSLISITFEEDSQLNIIGEWAFGFCSSLTSIIIPSGVTSIGEDAFCSSLESVYYEGTIEDWCKITFSYYASNPMYYASNFYMKDENDEYKKVTIIEIPNTITSIGKYQFRGFNNVTSIVIPSSVTSIGEGAFEGCTSLETITLPFVGGSKDDNQELSYIFSSVPDSLKEVIILEGCTSIGEYAFYCCSSLKSITLPSSVTYIGKSAFSGCSSLETTTLPFIGESKDSNQYLGYIFGTGSYSGYYGFIPNSLKEVVILEGCISIGEGAFYNCGSLTNIVIPSSVESIGSYAFYKCSSLTSIIIPSSVTSIGVDAFCSSLESVYYDGTIEDWCNITFSNKYSNPISCTLHFYMKDENDKYIDFNKLTTIETPNTITSIGDYQFCGFSNVTSVFIPSSVTSIGEGAFSGCSSLTNLIIPSSVTSIGSNAFSDCGSLTSITIPSGVTLIERGTFSGCSLLASIVIPSSVTSIGSNAFSDCGSLISITIPSGVTSIGSYVFSGCSSLETITLPFVGGSKDNNQKLSYIFGSVPSSLKEVIILEGCTSIGDYAFAWCDFLTNIVISNSVTSIEEYAFCGCSSLESVCYEGTIEDWCKISFYNSYSNPMYYALYFYMKNENNEYKEVTSIEIPDTITSIGKYQFHGFSNVTSVFIPSSVTSIGSNAFFNCSSLEKVYYEGTLEDWCKLKFDSSSANPMYFASHFYMKDENDEYKEVTSIEIPDTITSIGNYQFCGFSNVTSVFIPSSVTSIGEGAFSGCSSLTNLIIPSSVTSIGVDAFFNCIFLEKVYYEGTIEDWCKISFSSDNFYPLYHASHFYMKDENNEYKELTSIEIPDTITSIGDYQFCGFSNVTSVFIPSSVTSIGEGAFSGCSSLTNLIIPSSVTSIGSNAFSDCGSLISITIPSGVTLIERGTFSGCSLLASIVIPSGVTSIGEGAFSGCSSLTNLIIPTSVTSIGSNAFSDCGSLISITIPSGVTLIESGTFWYCSSLTSIVIPSSVTSIGENAFSGCSSLTSIEIPSSVTSVESQAFKDCSKLIICCEADSQPSGWNSNWNPSDRPVVWAY